MHVQLAEQDRPGGGQLLHGCGILFGEVVLEEERAGGGAHAARLVQVLERQRDAVQPAASAVCMDFSFRLAGGFQRKLRGEGNEAVQQRIDALDALQARLGQLDRGDAAVGNAFGSFADGEIGQ